jgi:glyceraldehyde 3-phosphate dehydrogenase
MSNPKPIRVAINGYGRIGRNILRACFENARTDKIEIVAINDLGSVDINTYLTEYDSTHGKFVGEVEVKDGNLVIDDQVIKVFAERDPSKLPWAELKIDVVYECTGLFATKDKAAVHLKAGAKKVLISAPAGNDVKTIVYGVNDKTLVAGDVIVSNASCTTNCLAPLVKPLHEAIGVESGIMTTIHSYTNDQKLTDVYHEDPRRARSATQSMIPTKTGAAAAVGLVLPELAGKLDGFAIRVPTINVSLVDLTFVPKRKTDVKEINAILKAAADGELQGILNYTDLQLVSIDFNGNPASATYDATLTKIVGNQVKVCAWYDNETGFSNRMLDTSLAMIKAK